VNEKKLKQNALNLLKKLGVKKDLPVFITETGWPHREGVKKQNTFYTTKTTSDFLIEALDLWEKDSLVKAITPFIYNYCQEPFDHFSWLSANGNLYPEYQKLIDLTKGQNDPEQIVSYEFQKINIPFLILENNHYDGEITLNKFSKVLGNIVVLKVGKHYFGYCHLDKPSPLKVGSKVKSGDVVGLCGTTGSASSGVHLHFTLSLLPEGVIGGKVYDGHAFLLKMMAAEKKRKSAPVAVVTQDAISKHCATCICKGNGN